MRVNKKRSLAQFAFTSCGAYDISLQFMSSTHDASHCNALIEWWDGKISRMLWQHQPVGNRWSFEPIKACGVAAGMLCPRVSLWKKDWVFKSLHFVSFLHVGTITNYAQNTPLAFNTAHTLKPNYYNAKNLLHWSSSIECSRDARVKAICRTQ